LDLRGDKCATDSFSRFLGLAIEDSIPDATTLWLFREKARQSVAEGLRPD
jgi:IS5 family transposase